MTETRNALADKSRKEFAKRLRRLLAEAGRPQIGATELRRVFNTYYDGAPITVHATRKWLEGEAMPTREKMVVLAEKVCRVPCRVLEYGEDAPERTDSALGDDPQLVKVVDLFKRLDGDGAELMFDVLETFVRKRERRAA